MNNEIKTERRKIFGLLGKSVIGISLLSIFPLNLLAKKNEGKKLRKVNIHPDAIKRGE